MEDEEMVERLNEAFKKIIDKDVDYGYDFFANKHIFHAVQEHNFFVIGTRLIVGPWKLNKKWKKLEDHFHETDVDHAEVYKTRNEALRAIARNRKGYEHEQVNNPHDVNFHGYNLHLFEGSKFTT